MEKDNITEKLKVLELEAMNLKIDFNSYNIKLKIAYEYETELLRRLENARSNTKLLQENVFQTSSKLADTFQKMKNELDIYTGNFLKL